MLFMESVWHWHACALNMHSRCSLLTPCSYACATRALQVLPPTHYLKSGPTRADVCCRRRHGTPLGTARPTQCKRRPRSLSASPWRAPSEEVQRESGAHHRAAHRAASKKVMHSDSRDERQGAERDTSKRHGKSKEHRSMGVPSPPRFLLSWAGQASGPGLGRHGGSGPRARSWLAAVVGASRASHTRSPHHGHFGTRART